MSSCSQERYSASRTVFVTGAARARIQHLGCLVGACGLCLLCGALSPNHAWRIELLTRQERITELTHAVARRPHDSHEAFERLRTLFRDGNDGWHGFCKVVKNDQGQEVLDRLDIGPYGVLELQNGFMTAMSMAVNGPGGGQSKLMEKLDEWRENLLQDMKDRKVQSHNP